MAGWPVTPGNLSPHFHRRGASGLLDAATDETLRVRVARPDSAAPMPFKCRSKNAFTASSNSRPPTPTPWPAPWMV